MAGGSSSPSAVTTRLSHGQRTNQVLEIIRAGLPPGTPLETRASNRGTRQKVYPHSFAGDVWSFWDENSFHCISTSENFNVKRADDGCVILRICPAIQIRP